MNIIYTIETISPLLLEEVVQLFQENNSPKKYNPAQFEYPKNIYSIAITARENGKLIGFNGTMNRTLYFANKNLTSDGIWSCDFIVANEYQGKGVGKEIKKKLKSAISGQILSLGISDKARALLAKNGWNTDVSLLSFRKIIKPRSSKSLIGYLVGKLLVCRRLQFKKEQYTDAFLFTTMPSESEIDGLWEDVKTLYGNTIARTGQYFQYRFNKQLSKNAQCLIMRDRAGSISSIFIFKYKTKTIDILDYLGDFTDQNSFNKAIEAFSVFYHVESINIKASHPNFILCLKYAGFIKTNSKSAFASLTSKKDLNTTKVSNDWFLTAADSDGELIKTLRDNTTNPTLFVYENLTFHNVGDEDFSEFEQQWNNVLENSNANSLFLSFYWVYQWWTTWKAALAEKAPCKLSITIIKDIKTGKILGILPLYKMLKKKFGMQYIEYQFLGNAINTIPTVRSEYIGPVFIKQYEKQCFQAFSCYIKSMPVRTKLYWPDSTENDYIQLFNHRVKKVDHGYKVNVKGSTFEQYAKTLGKNTRLKGISRHKKLNDSYDSVEWKDNVPVNKFFNELNQLHELRWEKPCFDKHALAFHKALNNHSNELIYTREILIINQKTISANYNITSKGVTYNIQSSFDPHFNQTYSFGIMHFLKGIKTGFLSETINAYDFLAGQGKHSDYKKRFKGSQVHFYTYEVYSRSWISTLVKYAVKLLTILRFFKSNSPLTKKHSH